MAVLSKIKIGDAIYDLKDSASREELVTLLGDHAVEALGSAAWLDVDNSVTDGASGVATTSAVKAYVDAQVGAIPGFDVVIDTWNTSKDAPATAASADTFHKIYMVEDANASAGNYIEFITIRSGSEGNYTYAWEKIGSTKADLTGYVTKETTVAGIKLDHNITTAELEASTALNLGDLAHKDSAEGTVAGQTISGVKATGSVSGTAAITSSSVATAITSTGKVTPAGTISGGKTTAAGTISGAIAKDNVNGVEITGSVSAPEITVTPATKTVQHLTSVGTAASLTEGSYTAPTLASATTSTFAKEGVTASIDATDSEMLVIATASTASAVTEQGKFDAGKVEFGKFTPNTLPVLGEEETVLSGVTVTASAPTFAGDKFAFAGSFEGSETAVTGETFTGTEADVSVDGSYDKVTVDAEAVVTASNVSLDVSDITVAAKDVTVK